MKLVNVLIMDVLRYFMNTFQFMTEEFRREELSKYYDKSNSFYDLEDLEENKFKFFSYYTTSYDLSKVYQLTNNDKINLNLEFLFIKNNHNSKFYEYNIFLKEVFNKTLNLTFLVYSVVTFDNISSFIVFKNNEDYLRVKHYLEELEKSNNLTIKNFLKLDKIEDKSFFFSKKELELLKDIDNFKYNITSNSIEYYLEELSFYKDLVYLIDLKIDLFKSIMTNNSIKLNKNVKLSTKTSLNVLKLNKISSNFFSKSTNHNDLDKITKFYLNEKDLKQLEKDLEVLDILISKYNFFSSRIEELEDKLEELNKKEDLFKFSSLLNLNEDSLEDYDNFNYYAYYKKLEDI